MFPTVSQYAIALALCLSIDYAKGVAALQPPKALRITNFVTGCYAEYATMNNAWQYAPSTPTNCMQFYATIPAGWELVPATDEDAILVIRKYSFGSDAIVLADGTSYQTNTGAAVASNPILKDPILGIKVTSCSPTTAILIRRAYPLPPMQMDFVLPMKTLLLSSSNDLGAVPQWVYNAYGAPLDYVDLSRFPNGYTLVLESAPGVPKYNGIILTNAKLAVEGKDGWGNVLTPQQMLELRSYRAKYGVRMVVLSTDTDADLGLIRATNSTAGTSAAAIVTWMDNPLAAAINDSVPLSATFSFRPSTTFWFPATKEDKSRQITPFLQINNTYVGAFTRECGRPGEGVLQEMYFMFNMNVYTNSSFALGDVWFTWLNKGLYIGQRRILLNTQVDDVFIGTTLFNVSSGRRAFDANSANLKSESNNSYRFSGTDLLNSVAYQNDLKLRLPLESNYKMELAFNGMGWDFHKDAPDSTNNVVESVRENFNWLSHTFSHMDLYCPDELCKNGFTKYIDSYGDLQLNKDFARHTLFSRKWTGTQWVNITDAEFNAIPNYTPGGIVTPGISGLNLSDSIQALVDAGITYAVGDNSRVDLKPLNIFHPFVTNVTGTRGGKLNVIPRFATRVYYDSSLPHENAEEYNAIYGPTCLGWNQKVELSVNGQLKCNASSLKNDHDFQWDEVMEIEGMEVARNLLSKRTDPYMFHQANMRFFTLPDGSKHSLITRWVDAVLNHLLQYSVLPVQSMRFQDLHDFYVARAARDNCGISGAITYSGGSPASVKMTSIGKCDISLTRSTGVQVSISQNSRRRDQSSEIYGPDETVSIPSDSTKPTVINLQKCTGPCHVGASNIPKVPSSPAPSQSASQPKGTGVMETATVGGIPSDSTGLPMWAIVTAAVLSLLVVVAVISGVCFCKRKAPKEKKLVFEAQQNV